MSLSTRPLKELFLEALDVPPHDRAAWLDRECGENAELRDQLERMLSAHDAPQSLLDRTALVATGAAAPSSIAEKPGTQVGPYKLLEQIGEGGMGVVYMAEQSEPVRRKVAMKIIKPGMDTRQVIARFDAERHALSLMNHPNIAQVLDAGETDAGRPYFVMELVKGSPITEYCDQRQLTPRQRLEMFLPVCRAIQHAHQKGIIHRDIKPANVLVAEYDGSPVPKVIDFGVAKAVGAPLTERTMFTGFGQLVGTLEYMSPEQARVNQLDIDTRSDIYSLGVLLYELLTGSTPRDRQRLRSAAWDEMLRIIREEEPPKPSTRLFESRDTLASISARRQSEPAGLTKMIQGDLDWIVMKALERERNRRYETANALARDIERHLADEMIEARPPTAGYRLRKFARQHRAALMTAVSLAFCLIVGTTLSTWLAVRATRAEQAARQAVLFAREAESMALARQVEADHGRQEMEIQRQEANYQRDQAQTQRDEAERQRAAAQSERLDAQRNVTANQLLLGKIALSNGELAEALIAFHQAYHHAPLDDPGRTSARNLIGAWGGGLRRTLVHEGGVHTTAVSADGGTLLTGYFHSRAQAWDLATGLPQGAPLPHHGDIVSAQVSADGSFALIGDWEGAKVWELATSKLRYPPLEHAVREDTVVGPVLSPDERTIVTRSSFESIRLWDAQTGAPRGDSLSLGNHVHRMMFSPDSKRVAAVGGGQVRIWDAETAQPIGDPFANVTDLAFHPHKNVVAISCNDGQLILQDLDSAERLTQLTHERSLASVQFDPAGQSLVTHDEESAYVWQDVLSDQRAKRTLTHGQQLFTAAFSSTDGRVVTASPLLLRAWKLGADNPLWERTRPNSSTRFRSDRIKSVKFSPDGKSLLTRMENDLVEVLSAKSGESVIRESKAGQAIFAPDGKTLLVGSREGWLRVRELDAEDERRLPKKLTAEICSGSASALSSDGKLIFVVGLNRSGIFRTDTWEPVGKPLEGLAYDAKEMVADAAFSPDGRLLLASTISRGPAITSPSTMQLSIWDVATSSRIGDPIAAGSAGAKLGFDATGASAYFGAACLDVGSRTIRRFPPESVPAGHRATVQLLGHVGAYAPPLWDQERDAPTSVAVPNGAAKQTQLSGDGRRLLFVGADGSARLYEIAASTPVGPPFQPEGAVRALSRDGRYVLFGSHDALRLWNAQTGRPCGDTLLDEYANPRFAFSPDGTVLATFWQFSARLWDCASGMMLGPPLPMPSNSSGQPLFSPDGRTLYLPSHGLEVWRVASPAVDDADRLRLSVEVRTGLEVDEHSTVRKLSQAEWLERSRRLEQLGGSCDVVDTNGTPVKSTSKIAVPAKAKTTPSAFNATISTDEAGSDSAPTRQEPGGLRNEEPGGLRRAATSVGAISPAAETSAETYRATARL